MKFTFHNVSINSHLQEYLWIQMVKFTFHNVSINSLQTALEQLVYANLHSTMFLLIPVEVVAPKPPYYHLHSTMFLLIP